MMKPIGTIVCVVMALAFAGQSADARRFAAASSDACFTDPRGTMRDILNEMRYTFGQIWGYWDNVRIYPYGYTGVVHIIGWYKGDPVHYFDYRVDGKINRVVYQGKERSVTFDAEEDACDLMEKTMSHYGIGLPRY